MDNCNKKDTYYHDTVTEVFAIYYYTKIYVKYKRAVLLGICNILLRIRRFVNMYGR